MSEPFKTTGDIYAALCAGKTVISKAGTMVKLTDGDVTNYNCDFKKWNRIALNFDTPFFWSLYEEPPPPKKLVKAWLWFQPSIESKLHVKNSGNIGTTFFTEKQFTEAMSQDYFAPNMRLFTEGPSIEVEE